MRRHRIDGDRHATIVASEVTEHSGDNDDDNDRRETNPDLASSHAPAAIVARVAENTSRSRFTELPSALQSLVYAFGAVGDHFRLARCARSLARVATLPSSSPAVVIVAAPAIDANAESPLPRSLLALRPSGLGVERRFVAHLPELSDMSSVRRLDLHVDWGAQPATPAPADDSSVWHSLKRFAKLATLSLIVGKWQEAVPAVAAVGAQLETLSVDVCVTHSPFDFSCLSVCVRLTALRLIDVEFAADRTGLRCVARCAPRLTHLDLRWAPSQIGWKPAVPGDAPPPIDLAFLSDFTQLRRLEISASDRVVALPPIGMPHLERATFATTRFAVPSSFRGWSRLVSLRLPAAPLSDPELPASLTHLDASALDATEIARFARTPLPPRLAHLVVGRSSAASAQDERDDGAVAAFRRHAVECCGASLEIEWVDRP